MKKIILSSIFVVLLVFTYLATSSYYELNSYDIKLLKKCHKTKMYEVFLCPGSGNYTPLTNVSKHFKDLIVIAEDSSFFSHKGLDWHELKESFKINLRAFSYLRGGSTITQQLVKNVFLSPKKSLKRKFIEAMLAQKIEKTYSKKLILEKYVNVIEFGKNIYGINKASNHYFGKSPHQLNELESAFLVYLVPSPKKYSKVFYDKKLTPWSKKRISTLLRKLKNFKKISEARYNILLTKIDQFPWKNTYLNSNENIFGEPLDGISDTDEKVIQEEISREIEKELQLENKVLDD